jgi:tetratricopeptide (TPR) repeat protein
MVSNGKYQRAIKDYSNAISRSPGMISAYEKRAKLYSSTGEKSKAVGDYIRVGEIYRVKGKPANAVSAFRTALEISPENKIALAGRGGAWMDQGDYRPAIVDFDAALDQDSKFYPALFGAGICEFKMGDYKRADKYFKNAYKINKDDPYLYQYMMLNYLAKDDIKKVRKIYAEFKDNGSAKDLAEFKASPKNEPILRLIKEEDR